ncbi:MAG: hypothetical protein WA888_00420 [Burkholderiaceae bacterium]
MTTPETLAVIPEDEASGETARIYAEIRETLGIVNLIWRHMATFDGALQWAWSALGPVYSSGAVTAGADDLRTSARSLLQPIEPVPEEVLRCIGLSSDDCCAIAEIVGSYELGNAANLIATNALLQRVAAMPGPTEVAGSAKPVAAARKHESRSMYRILPIAELDASTAALVGRLNELCCTHDRPILVSIYRHLGHWPAFLALAWTQIAPLAATNHLAECSLKIKCLGNEKASHLADLLHPTGRHPAGEKALGIFLERIGFPRMVAITAVHAQSLALVGSRQKRQR